MKIKILAGVLVAGAAIGGIAGVSRMAGREKVANAGVNETEVLAENMTVEQPIWESYDCDPEVAAFGDEIFGSGIVVNVKRHSDETFKTDIPALPNCFLENPRVQIDDKIFSTNETTLEQVLEAFKDDERYSISLAGKNVMDVIPEDAEIQEDTEIILHKYGEQYAYLCFAGDETLSAYSLDNVYLQSIEPELSTDISGQNIWYQGGFRADGGSLTCSELEEIFSQKGIHIVKEEQIPDELPYEVSLEMRQTGLANIVEKNEEAYGCNAYIVYDAPEEFSLKGYHYHFDYDQNSQKITKIRLVEDRRILYPLQKFRIDGKDAYTAQYLECGNYRTALTKAQQEDEVIIYGEVCKMEHGMEDDKKETVLDAVSGDSLNYSGKLEIRTNNGDGTYLCSDGQTDYILTVSDAAQIYLISFSENADNNYQILVQGNAFKQLPFGYDTVYEGSPLYDFAGEFGGDAVVENGEITYFNEYFRQ